MDRGEVILSLVIGAIYFLPTVVAFNRKFRHPYRWLIFIGNVLFGATVIGWFLLLAVAWFGDVTPTKTCPHCAEVIYASAEVCPYCGNRTERTLPVANQRALPDPPNSVPRPTEREEILASALASLYFGFFDSVGGKLTVTTHRVIFKSHIFNFYRIPVEMALTEIAAVFKRNILLVFRTKNDREYRFYTFSRNRLMRVVTSQLAKLPAAPGSV